MIYMMCYILYEYINFILLMYFFYELTSFLKISNKWISKIIIYGWNSTQIFKHQIV